MWLNQIYWEIEIKYRGCNREARQANIDELGRGNKWLIFYGNNAYLADSFISFLNMITNRLLEMLFFIITFNDAFHISMWMKVGQFDSM